VPSPAEVHEQLTDILVRVVGCPADAVVPAARLKDLGVDSLAIVEVGEELGRRFDLQLSDGTIDGLVTVQDAIDSVVGHDGPKRPLGPSVPAIADTPATADQKGATVPPHDTDPHRGRIIGFAVWFTIVGAVIGVVLGVGGAALVSASGIGAVDLPSVSATTTPTPTQTTTKAPAPEPTETDAEPEPSIEASGTRVSPGTKFVLSGVFPGSDKGEQLQVEVKDEGAEWDDFPIQPQTRDGGTFKTELYTSRTGAREFRVTNTETNESTPSVKIEIG
jgi:acyl carrier protein